MINKTNGFLSKLGNIFKSEEEALREDRREVLCKYLLKEAHEYSWQSDNRFEKVTIVRDNMAVENFLKYYEDVMRQLKEVDKNANV